MKERKETEKEVYYTNESNDSGQLFDLLMNDNDEDDSGGRSGGAELVGPPVEQNTFNVEEEEDIMHDGKDLEEQTEVHGDNEETVSGLEDHSTPISSNVVVDSSSSTLYHCNNTATTDNGGTTNKGKITKQLIQFDYDVLLSKTSSSVLQSKEKEEEMKKRYNNVDKDKDDTIEEKEDEDNDDLQVIIAEFEQQLLKDVALSLNDAGICNSNNSGSVEDDDSQEGVRKVMVLRKVANNQDSSGSEGVELVELSSLPLDEIDDSATCAKDTLQQSFSSSNEESIACYPVTGYMTAYFTSASNTDNDDATTSSSKDVQSKIQDIIQRTITETSSSTLKGSVSPTIVGVYYVGDRETFTNNESQLDNDSSSHSNSNGQIASLLKTEPSSSSLNTGTLIGLILGTLAAFLLLTLFILRRRRTKKQRKNGTEATAENDDGLDHECYARGNGNIKRNMVEEERSVIPQMAFSTSSSSPPPPFVVDNIPTHQEYSPKGQQQVDQWVSHTMTTETDMTPVVSNITSSSSKQRYSYNRSGNHYLDEEKEIIQEFDEDDYDDDDEEESYY